MLASMGMCWAAEEEAYWPIALSSSFSVSLAHTVLSSRGCAVMEGRVELE